MVDMTDTEREVNLYGWPRVIEARDSRIADLDRQIAELRAERGRQCDENVSLIERQAVIEAERDRLAAALEEIARGCEGRVDLDHLACRVARAALDTAKGAGE